MAKFKLGKIHFIYYSDRLFLGQPKSFSIQLAKVHITEGGFCSVFWGSSVLLLFCIFGGCGRLGFGGVVFKNGYSMSSGGLGKESFHHCSSN